MKQQINEVRRMQQLAGLINENEDAELADAAKDTIEKALTPSDEDFLINLYKQEGGKELIAKELEKMVDELDEIWNKKNIDQVSRSVIPGIGLAKSVPQGGEFDMSKPEIRLRQILDAIGKYAKIGGALGAVEQSYSPANLTTSIGLGIAALAGYGLSHAAWWKKKAAKSKYGSSLDNPLI